VTPRCRTPRSAFAAAAERVRPGANVRLWTLPTPEPTPCPGGRGRSAGRPLRFVSCDGGVEVRPTGARQLAQRVACCPCWLRAAPAWCGQRGRRRHKRGVGRGVVRVQLSGAGGRAPVGGGGVAVSAVTSSGSSWVRRGSRVLRRLPDGERRRRRQRLGFLGAVVQEPTRSTATSKARPSAVPTAAGARGAALLFGLRGAVPPRVRTARRGAPARVGRGVSPARAGGGWRASAALGRWWRRCLDRRVVQRRRRNRRGHDGGQIALRRRRGHRRHVRHGAFRPRHRPRAPAVKSTSEVGGLGRRAPARRRSVGSSACFISVAGAGLYRASTARLLQLGSGVTSAACGLRSGAARPPARPRLASAAFDPSATVSGSHPRPRLAPARALPPAGVGRQRWIIDVLVANVPSWGVAVAAWPAPPVVVDVEAAGCWSVDRHALQVDPDRTWTGLTPAGRSGSGRKGRADDDVVDAVIDQKLQPRGRQDREAVY
jgi:hypothetical protein